MKTNMQFTSLEAFYGIQHKLNNKEQEVLRVLHDLQPASDRELADKLHWELGSINGRRNSLVEKGVVEEAYRDKSPVTGRRVIYWKINESFRPEPAKVTSPENTKLFNVDPQRRFL